MIDWSTIKATIRDQVVAHGGFQPSQVIWSDEARGGAWDNPPTIYLRLSSVQDVGAQDERRTQPTATDDAIVELVEQKTFMLSLRVESFEQDIASPKHAGSVLSTLRTRLRRSTAIFSRAGIFCILDYGRVNRADYKDQSGRQVSRYTADLRCATVDSDIDTTAGAGGWIKEVQGTGTLDAGLPTVATDVTS